MAQKTLEYLREVRHLSDAVLKEFRFGYAPRDTPHELAGRIIMPLYNPYDEIVAITSRDIECPPKFQHWHESFEKSLHLYGINVAKRSIQKTDKAIVVEGQFDTACLHTYGLKMTVGICGTAFSIQHAIMLSRYCSEIYILFDSDGGKKDAGKIATEAVMKLSDTYNLRNYNIKLYPAYLPDGYDPDDFIVQHGRDGLFEVLREAKERNQ